MGETEISNIFPNLETGKQLQLSHRSPRRRRRGRKRRGGRNSRIIARFFPFRLCVRVTKCGKGGERGGRGATTMADFGRGRRKRRRKRKHLLAPIFVPDDETGWKKKDFLCLRLLFPPPPSPKRIIFRNKGKEEKKSHKYGDLGIFGRRIHFSSAFFPFHTHSSTIFLTLFFFHTGEFQVLIYGRCDPPKSPKSPTLLPLLFYHPKVIDGCGKWGDIQPSLLSSFT